jgi:hypothetical protein
MKEHNRNKKQGIRDDKDRS